MGLVWRLTRRRVGDVSARLAPAPSELPAFPQSGRSIFVSSFVCASGATTRTRREARQANEGREMRRQRGGVEALEPAGG